MPSRPRLLQSVPARLIPVLPIFSALVMAAAAALAPAAAVQATRDGAAPSPDDVVSTAAPVDVDGVGGEDPRPASQSLSDPAVLEFWTPERMESATPVEATVSEEDVRHAQETAAQAEEGEVTEPEQLSEPTSPTTDAQPAQAPEVTNFSPTNGRVFFRKSSDGALYSCSASAVNSGSKRLVVTAGHCVHGGRGGDWHQNWVFVPGYNQGSTPYGTFQANELITFRGWVDNGGATASAYAHDVAFVTTFADGGGNSVVNVVGGHGLYTGGSREFDVNVFGYPANRDSGEVMQACRGRTTTMRLLATLFPRIEGCDFGGGSSGGPWLHGYSNDTGQGYVRSVTSFGPRDNTSYIAGPYFSDAVSTLFSYAGSR